MKLKNTPSLLITANLSNMDFEITKYNNFFKLSGVFNRRSLPLFQSEFEHVFDKLDKLTISLENLENIDRYGVMAIAKLNNEAITKQKSLSIIGFGCKEVFEHFTNSDAA